MSHSTILLKVGLDNFIFFQLCNEGIHNSVTVLLDFESLREKNGSDYVPTRHSNSNTNLLIMYNWIIKHEKKYLVHYVKNLSIAICLHWLSTTSSLSVKKYGGRCVPDPVYYVIYMTSDSTL